MAQETALLNKLKQELKRNSKVPRTPDGLYSTMNQMGYMTQNLDFFSKKFTNLCKHVKKPVLDIGSAYGVASIPALLEGAKVIANDLSEDHLKILSNLAPAEFKENLTLQPGNFPQDIHFEESSLSMIYSARVFHFFSGKIIEESLEKIFKWLEPGGYFFLISETPYLKDYKKFIPVFEQRKKEGIKWPGEIPDISLYSPKRLGNVPTSFNLLDPETVSNHLHNLGFDVIETTFIARPDFPDDLRYDGRESMGVMAQKPF